MKHSNTLRPKGWKQCVEGPHMHRGGFPQYPKQARETLRLCVALCNCAKFTEDITSLKWYYCIPCANQNTFHWLFDFETLFNSATCSLSSITVLLIDAASFTCRNDLTMLQQLCIACPSQSIAMARGGIETIQIKFLFSIEMFLAFPRPAGQCPVSISRTSSAWMRNCRQIIAIFWRLMTWPGPHIGSVTYFTTHPRYGRFGKFSIQASGPWISRVCW